jgi:hypothetical protein
MGDADRELGKCLPQCPLLVGAVLPCGLEHFVRVERQPPVQQVLGKGQGFGRRQIEVIGNAWSAFAAPRKWSTECVAGTIASGPAGFVAITLSHVLIMASVQISFPTGRPTD